MKLHREGYAIIATAVILLTGIQLANFWLWGKLEWNWLFILLTIVVVALLYLVVQFFRVPSIQVNANPLDVLCPADGKVVVIEEVEETEYFKDRRIQISVFMSPLNVHANFNPISGVFKYVKYHAGLFLVAWHPKSSTDNERTTMVIEHENGQEILFRQIAGALARRICYYVEAGDQATVGGEFGFIKFGSRVDIFLPLGTNVEVELNQVVKGRLTKLATLVEK